MLWIISTTCCSISSSLEFSIGGALQPAEMRHRGAGMHHKLMKQGLGAKLRIGPVARAERVFALTLVAEAVQPEMQAADFLAEKDSGDCGAFGT
jgi:hypothetical protein